MGIIVKKVYKQYKNVFMCGYGKYYENELNLNTIKKKKNHLFSIKKMLIFQINFFFIIIFYSLKEHYRIDDDTFSLIKISEIYDEFCQFFPNTSSKAFGMCIRKAFPSIKKKNSNSTAFYTNIKRIIGKCKCFS